MGNPGSNSALGTLQHPTKGRAPRNPPGRALSVAVGIVIFDNAPARLADLARTLRCAITRLEESEGRANARGETVCSIRLHNNGDALADPMLFGPRAVATNSAVNLGVGRGHNLLMREAFEGDAHAQFYLMLDPEGMLHPDALVEMIAVARRCEGRALVEAAQFPEELPKIFDPLTLDTPWASGTCLLIPAAVYAGIGGFDDNIFMFYEDVDLSWRARQAGYAVKHAPRALFHHRFNRPGTEGPYRRAQLDAARYLAVKWGGDEFASDVERTIIQGGGKPNVLPATWSSPQVNSIADFVNGLNFAPTRWTRTDLFPLTPFAVTRISTAPLTSSFGFTIQAKFGACHDVCFRFTGSCTSPFKCFWCCRGSTTSAWSWSKTA